MYLLDENLYCLTSTNRVITLDAAKGTPKWSCDIAKPGVTVFEPCHGDDMVLPEKPLTIKQMTSYEHEQPVTIRFKGVCFNTLSRLVVLNRTNGVVIRDIRLDFAANTGGATDGSLFFVGSTKGWFYAISLSDTMTQWYMHTDDMISAPVRYHDGRVYVASEDGSMYAAVFGRKGKRVWKKNMTGPVTAAFRVNDKGCFVPCEDRRIYAFDILNGSPLWMPFACHGPLRRPIQLTERTIFQYADRDRFYAVDIATGKKRWSMRTGRKVLAMLGGNAYILDAGRNLLIVNEILGTVKHSLPLTGMDLFVGNTKAPAIYTATRSGKVFCIRSAGAGHLTPEMLSNTTP